MTTIKPYVGIRIRFQSFNYTGEYTGIIVSLAPGTLTIEWYGREGSGSIKAGRRTVYPKETTTLDDVLWRISPLLSHSTFDWTGIYEQ